MSICHFNSETHYFNYPGHVCLNLTGCVLYHESTPLLILRTIANLPSPDSLLDYNSPAHWFPIITLLSCNILNSLINALLSASQSLPPKHSSVSLKPYLHQLLKRKYRHTHSYIMFAYPILNKYIPLSTYTYILTKTDSDLHPDFTELKLYMCECIFIYKCAIFIL